MPRALHHTLAAVATILTLAYTGGESLAVLVGGVLATAAGVLLLLRRDHED